MSFPVSSPLPVAGAFGSARVCRQVQAKGRWRRAPWPAVVALADGWQQVPVRRGGFPRAA